MPAFITHQLRCGNPHPPPYEVPGARLGGPQTGRQHPYAGILFPIGRFPRPRTDPSYARGQGFSPKASPLCHPLRNLGGLGAHAPAIGHPMTPHVCSCASALGLWGTGDRVPRFPDHRRWGRWSGYHPRSHFRNTQPEHRSPDLSGSPNHQSPGSPPGMWIGLGRATASQRLRSPLSAAPARISPRTRLPRQPNACGGYVMR